ncbi:uncharacterized protein LOC141613384 [Silene latifolia]|uniref:uncharacterized protein LOC141613384 n=1 Tax=Silene latifolia TaxID=37657 RepID=UPI003D76E959
MSRFLLHEDESVRYDGRWCVPEDADMRKVIMTEAHWTPYSVHPDCDKLYKDLKKTFWWPRMKKDVADFVARCLTCQRVKGEQRRPQGKVQSLKDDSAEAVVLGPDMVQEMVEQVKFICEKMKAAQDRQKSYADLHRRAVEFQVGNKVLFKVSPMKGVMHFGKKGELSQKYIGPYEYVTDPSHILEVGHIELDETLIYVETSERNLGSQSAQYKEGQNCVT